VYIPMGIHIGVDSPNRLLAMSSFVWGLSHWVRLAKFSTIWPDEISNPFVAPYVKRLLESV